VTPRRARSCLRLGLLSTGSSARAADP
jgi:hypothetical protein